MKRISAIISTIAVASLAATPVSAKDEPIILAPSSAWAVDYKDDSCRLMRRFGTGDDAVVAIFNRYVPGQTFRLTLAGKTVARNFGKTGGEAMLQFGPAEQVQQVDFLSGETGDLPAMIIKNLLAIAPIPKPVMKAGDEHPAVDLPPAMLPPERIAAVRTLTIDRRFLKPVTLNLGNFGKASAALDSCLDDLLMQWSLDPVKHRSLSRYARPSSSPREWLRAGDYPAEMLRERQGALIQARLIVGADGIPKSCHIQETTGPKAFDDAVCGSLMKRARFTPALDKDGLAIDSYWANQIHFAISRRR